MAVLHFHNFHAFNADVRYLFTFLPVGFMVVLVKSVVLCQTNTSIFGFKKFDENRSRYTAGIAVQQVVDVG